jgi:hypothetical protein
MRGGALVPGIDAADAERCISWRNQTTIGTVPLDVHMLGTGGAPNATGAEARPDPAVWCTKALPSLLQHNGVSPVRVPSTGVSFTWRLEDNFHGLG